MAVVAVILVVVVVGGAVVAGVAGIHDRWMKILTRNTMKWTQKGAGVQVQSALRSENRNAHWFSNIAFFDTTIARVPPK
jgi:hypothetical protein